MCIFLSIRLYVAYHLPVAKPDTSDTAIHYKSDNGDDDDDDDDDYDDYVYICDVGRAKKKVQGNKNQLLLLISFHIRYETCLQCENYGCFLW
jgi:hypothetical protein